MDILAFTNHLRFLASDGPTSNLIQREKLADRPGNVFDGSNTVYNLNNRRITGLTLYDENNLEVSATNYTLISATGRIICAAPPASPATYADYTFNMASDDEMLQAISGAAASGNFDPNNVQPAQLDYCAQYALAYVYTSRASRAGEYYTISSGGRQISKSELFNHYTALANTALKNALDLRTDARKDRGDRDIPADGYASSSWVKPYVQDGGGG